MLSSTELDNQLARERRFHDELSRTFDPAKLAPGTLGALEEAALEMLGPLEGKRVLDIGCGMGVFTLELLNRGAIVTAVDLSPGMLEIARQRVELYGPRAAKVDYHASAAESLPLPDKSFDLVIGKFILHHLELERAAHEIARVMARGGSGVFIENSGKNPVLMLARQHVAGHFGIPRFGTKDERPLGQKELRTLRSSFEAVNLDYPRFDFWTIFDRQVLRQRWRLGSKICSAWDAWIWRVFPVVRPLSFRVIVTVNAEGIDRSMGYSSAR